MKKFLLFIGILAIVGGVVCIVVAGLNGASFNYNIYDINSYDTKQRTVANYLETNTSQTSMTLETQLLDCSLFVTFADLGGDGMRVNSPDMEGVFTITQSDNGLKIVQNEFINQHYGWLQALFAKDKRYIAIEIDSSIANIVEYNIEVDMGQVKLSDGVGSNVSIEVETGAIIVDKFDALTMSLEAKTGAVTAKDVTVADSFDINVNTGAITISNSQAATLHAKTITGSVYCNGVSAADVTLEATTGSASCNNLKNCERLSITVQTGTINGSIYATRDEYTIKASTHTGSCHVHNQTVAGNKWVELKCGTGSVSFSFKTVAQ